MPKLRGRPGHAAIRVDSDIGKKEKKIGDLIPVIEHIRGCLDSQPDYFGLSLWLEGAQDDLVLDILESPADSPVKISLLYRSVLQSPVGLDEMSIHRYAPPRVEAEVITVREVALTRGMVALVDDEDYESVSEYAWEASVTQAVYALRKIRSQNGRQVRVKMHDQIMCPPDGSRVEHINGDALDNRRENLRIAP